MSEPVVPIPEDIRQMIIALWSEEQVDAVLSAKQPLLADHSARELIASGNEAAVRTWLRQLTEGAYL
jgi:hypothetical protein